ncbi:MAG: hypothetical protein KC912_13365 [Proteobacteria bacterium]|nr:hypothetical protein [Pseudomonadota bacterium]
MNEADLKEFSSSFSVTERKVWDSNFSSRDDMTHMMTSMALVKLYAKGIDALIKRPPSPPDGWFDSYATEQGAKLVTREVFAVAAFDDGGLIYASAAGPNAVRGRLAWRLLVRDTPKGRRVVGMARACPTCQVAGTHSGAACGACGGVRWKHTQGQDVTAGTERGALEIVVEPSADASRALWSYLEAGGH